MPSTRSATFPFLRHGGAASQLVLQHDWSGTALGPIGNWPANLRSTVGLMLGSRMPMALWWGADSIHFFNDAYLSILSPERRVGLLGMRGADRREADWSALQPAILKVMDNGGSISGLDALTMPDHAGGQAATWDFELLPVDGDDRVDGVLAVLTEASTQLSDDGTFIGETGKLLEFFNESPGFICVLSGPQHVFRFVNLEYRRLMGERDYINRSVHEVVSEVAGQGFFELLDDVYRTGTTFTGRRPLRYVAPGQPERVVQVTFVYKALKAPDGTIYGIFVEGTSSASPAGIDGVLSKREREVLSWIAMGKTAGETASILGISTRTCHAHVYSAARKLETSNSTQTVVEAIIRGELELKGARH